MASVESLFVGLIVGICAVFSVWRLLSLRLRLKALEWLSGLPPAAGGAWVATLRSRTLARLTGSGCAGCAAATHTINANVRPLNRKSGVPPR